MCGSSSMVYSLVTNTACDFGACVVRTGPELPGVPAFDLVDEPDASRDGPALGRDCASGRDVIGGA